MRAVVHDRYGPPEVLRIEEVERPVPNDDEVLVRVRATTVTRTDCHMRGAYPFLWRFMLGLRRPRKRILGLELAGEVEAVGAAVTEFEVGDQVFGIQGFNQPRPGAHAEYICMRESAPLAHKPSGLTFEEAAPVCDGGLAALGSLRKAGVREGQRILVYGASGSIGTAAVQLAKHFGAHVTAVCNTKNVEIVRSLGADEVIDYLHEDFTKIGKTYDVVFDAVGKHSFRRSKPALTRGGIYIATDGLRNFPLAFWTKRFGDKRVVFTLARLTKKNALFLKELIEVGRYRPVIDRIYPLEQVVEATRYVETQQKTGNVVLTLNRTNGRP
jgi:NADPH:quinone reductase-like Zn-dependent oxidoreductase